MPSRESALEDSIEVSVMLQYKNHWSEFTYVNDYMIVLVKFEEQINENYRYSLKAIIKYRARLWEIKKGIIYLGLVLYTKIKNIPTN